MATVVTHAVSSLDGFIARPDDSVGPLFDWYENGDTELYGAKGRGSSTSRRPRPSTSSRGGTRAGRW